MKALRLGRPRTHGHMSYGGPSNEYSVWSAMKARCYHPRALQYADYGGRGIAVCDEWREDFAAFLRDMGPRPPGHQIDRIDNDGPYCAANCRWTTPSEQAKNKRNTKRLTINGKTAHLAEWARRAGLAPGTLGSRLARGMAPELALHLIPKPRAARSTMQVTVADQTASVAGWAEAGRLPKTTIYARLSRGWSPDKAVDPTSGKRKTALTPRIAQEGLGR